MMMNSGEGGGIHNNSSSGNDSWPPPSLLAIDNDGSTGGVECLVDNLESLEVAGGVGAAPASNAAAVVAAVTHMTALLYLNDSISARHLWRRITTNAAANNANSELVRIAVTPWWLVAKDQLTGNIQGAILKLKDLQQQHQQSSSQQQPNHPFVQTYAKEIIYSYRRHLLRGWIFGTTSSTSIVPNHAPELLGFSNPMELQDFINSSRRQHQYEQLKGGKENQGAGSSIILTDVVSFLGSSKFT